MGVSFRLVLVLALALVSTTSGDSRFLPQEVRPVVQQLYQEDGGRLLWIDTSGQPTAVAWMALDQLMSASSDGLDPFDYQATALLETPQALRQGIGSADAGRFDAELSENVLRYLRDLHLGRVNPRTLRFHLDHALEPHDFPTVLRSAVSDGSLGDLIESLRPPFVQYRRLREALPAYRANNPAQARKIELALERLRWLPEFAGERLVVVNIPMFRVWAWNADRAGAVPVLEMAAIIGRASTMKSPVFAAPMTEVVLNPSWYVPDSIVVREVLPAMERDPRYPERNHMELTPTDGIPRVRQLPGPWNALGRVKFSFPNPFNVYLHDTPAPELFNEERRDFSHGCVRVANPLGLAEWGSKDKTAGLASASSRPLRREARSQSKSGSGPGSWCST